MLKKRFKIVHHSKITHSPCKPYSHEIDKNGMVSARRYRDQIGRIRYCCNPNHEHYYEESCFIATICYGVDSLEVLTLKKFRDNFLLKYKCGDFFIRFYYKIGPFIARNIKNRKLLSTFFRIILKPMVYIANKLSNE